MNVPSGPVEPLCPRKIRKQDDRSESEHCRDDEDEQRALSDPVQHASQPPYARPSGLRHARTLAAGAAGVGFEPTGDLSAASGFQDRPIRPLWHPAFGHSRSGMVRDRLS